MRFLEITFWLCAGLTFYAYAAYPLVVWCLSRVFGRKPVPPEVPDDQLPTVSLLIAAYNEESVIGDRLRNALATDYPPDRFRIVVASDGSSDRTAEIVRQFAGRGVTFLDYRARRGKSAVLNSAMATIDSELVLLSDANTDIEPQAVRRLARWFRDPSVGVVCGRLVLTDHATGENADGLYWKYETFLKKCEGRLGALLGSNGAIYAIRRGVYVPIPDDTVVDDFVIPLLAKQQSGCRIVYDSDAVAREETAEDLRAEFGRRARIAAGGFQAIVLLRKLLIPARGWVSFTFLSHKILRWLCPFFLMGMLLTSVLLWRHPFYRWALIAQVVFYAASQLAGTRATRSRLLKPLRLATMFTNMNLALLVGFWRWLRRRQKAAWDRTARAATAEAAAPAPPADSARQGA